MRIPRIYTEQQLVDGASIELQSGASQHIAKALRMRIGDTVTLFNGSGGEFSATIGAIDKRAVTVSVGRFCDTSSESGLKIHLGIAISRGERMDWVVQKTTELGVHEITPLFTERTEVKLPQDRAAKKLQHWRQVAISACEQCGRNQIPTVHNTTQLHHWLQSTDAEQKLVLHPRAREKTLHDRTPGNLALLVGPEGGLSESEIDSAERAQFQSLQLGPRVLRTETAPLAAIAVLQARWGDMG